MKKLFILLSFVFLLACEKDNYCWQCETTVMVLDDRDHHVVDSWAVEIEANEDEIRAFEALQTYSKDTLRVVTICKK